MEIGLDRLRRGAGQMEGGEVWSIPFVSWRAFLA